MKKIKINESQLNKIFEANGVSIPNVDNSDLKEFPGSEVNVTSNVLSPNGDLEYGNPTNTDKIQKTLTIQNYWANAKNGARVVP